MATVALQAAILGLFLLTATMVVAPVMLLGSGVALLTTPIAT